MTTFYGTAASNGFNGTSGNDIFYLDGTGGSTANSGSNYDTVYAAGGDDLIFGGKGNDFLYGESGNDEVNGGAGDDNVWGEDGNDVLIGGTGADWIVGGNGNDSLYAGAGNDRMFGDANDDNLYFGATSGGGSQEGTGGSGIDYFYLGSPGVDGQFSTIKDFSTASNERVYLQGLSGTIGNGSSNGSGYYRVTSGSDTLIYRDGFGSSVGKVEGVNLGTSAFYTFS